MAEGVARRIPNDAAEIDIGQGIQQRALRVQPEVIDGQPLRNEFTHYGLMGGDQLGRLRIVGKHDRKLLEDAILHATVAIGATEFDQAGEVATKLCGAVSHWNDEHEVMATVIATRGNQCFQPPPGRLIRRQQCGVEPAVPQRGFKFGNDGVLRRDVFVGASEPTGSGGRHVCRAGFR